MHKTTRFTVTLSAESADYFRALGEGNLSKGIYAARMMLTRASLEKVVDDFVVPSPPDNMDELLDGWAE